MAHNVNCDRCGRQIEIGETFHAVNVFRERCDAKGTVEIDVATDWVVAWCDSCGDTMTPDVWNKFVHRMAWRG